MKKYIKYIIMIICIMIFAFLSINIINKDLLEIDSFIYNLIKDYISDNLTIFAIIITNFGGIFVYIILVLFLFLWFKDNKVAFSVFLNLILVSSLNFLIKNIFQRARPNIFPIIRENGYSFPSGHSMISLAFYGYLIYLLYKKVNNKYLKLFGIVFLSILILLIGISRIYLGVHYASDVIGGFLLSLVYLIIYIMFVNKYLLKGVFDEK